MDVLKSLLNHSFTKRQISLCSAQTKIRHKDLATVGNTGKLDSRLSSMLDNIGFEYEIDDDGDLHVVVELGDNRLQQVVICSATHTVGAMEVRQLYSIGYESEAPLPQNIANLLLGINQSAQFGGWQLLSSGGRYYASYGAHIGADADADTFRAVIEVVVQAADNIEAYLTGKDVF